jgi:hypothetical protein
MNPKSKKTPFLAFIAGHGQRKVLSKRILITYLSNHVPGYSMVDIPSPEWKGFGFVYLKSQAALDAILKKRELVVNGCNL